MAVYTLAISVVLLTTTFTPFSSSCLTCSSLWLMLFISTTWGSRARISSTLVSAPDCTTGTSRMEAG